MRRREFIALVAGATAAWPLPTRAQQPAMPVIGCLFGISSEAGQAALAAVRKGLAQAGYVEGRNIAFDYRWADGQFDLLPAMVADLFARPVSLIFTGGGERPAFVAKAATTTIPIVVVIGSDPVKSGLVASLNRPGGNITGATIFSSEMESKRLGLLHEAIPAAKTVAALFNPENGGVDLQLNDVRTAAPKLGIEVLAFTAKNEADFDGIFETIKQRQAGALLVGADPYFNSRRSHLIALAAKYRLPAIYEFRQWAMDGGLMSYGTVLSDAYGQAGNYVGRILNGENPGDLPIVQQTNFEFVINLKTAKSLGLEISPTLSARADDVIE
jgi:putative tryptophan/tyrosine transport system substrate-binding protein